MTLADKSNLLAEHKRNPQATYSDLAKWAHQAFGLASTPTKSTIGKALKQDFSKGQRVDSKTRFINRAVKSPELEAELLQWVLRCEELGVCLTGELIREHAKEIAERLNLPSTQRSTYSKGWLYKFQRKHGLTSKIQHGEAASTPPEVVHRGRHEVLHTTSGYNPKNVYNMDETSFFYCLSPHRSITRQRLPGTKKSKKRISLALTTNADGSDVVEPLYIGTAVQPRCFNRMTGRELGFNYQSSKKAWMTSCIFKTYLSDLNERMVADGRKVLLLVDNAPCHDSSAGADLSNIELRMLPKNTTAYLQPQDAGIIASFKANVKKRQLKNALDQIDSVMSGRQDKLYEVPLLVAMEWARDAWRSVAPSTVSNCWRRTGILDTDLSAFSDRMAEMCVQ
ncbi:Aste57867_11773 [Aphanomyces stellatus]|uniref:Aste57867_11773 protein n=1 Tax=Aphanomyces stellatus TaxID=120398 RepID=A0A485KUC4_9STRA|nr:hypothetical protein As57867_011728 [Aphanomyces stellatus]VFT88629.1 Aste57867_11773 [Aphanomyces stellatus]